jgi:hypothetical protein
MPFNFILFWSGRMYADLLVVVPNYITSVSMNLPLSTSHRLNSPLHEFVPFAPVAKGAYAMQWGEVQVRVESYLRVEWAYYLHEAGMMEAVEKISRKKAEAHLRVRLDGDTGMGG